ncbi:probable proton pump-interactor BIP131 at N-terminal half [Coccomyxa sp. Obi]|nr:probable proton pump-interactor BIP131 at N-terminal half [Coccomyxa sp. Obi]
MGRPHEAPRAELDDEAFTADANGNGVENHDPVKSNSSPSEARKPDTLPAATAAAPPVADTALGNGMRRSSKKKSSWSGKNYEDMTAEEKEVFQQHAEAAFVATRKGRMHFVRLPTTIPGDSASLQQKRDERIQARKEIEQKSAEIRKKKAARQTYRDLRDQSLARLQGCRAKVNEAVNELKPYRQERNQERNQRKQLDMEDKAIFADVEFKSEAELDRAIRVLEDRQAHEGGRSLREELSLVKEITRLNGLRPSVRKAEEEAAKRAQARAEARKSEAPSTLSKEEQKEREKKLEEEIGRRMKERDAEEDQWKRYCDEADALNDEVDALLTERKALSDKLEGLENEIKELQGPLAELSKENRKFSREVRDIVQAGDVHRARKMCEAQADELMDLLGKDPEFRKNYIDLWAKQKKEIEEELERKGIISKPEHDSATAKPQVLEKAEDVIASVLRGAAAAQTLKERGAAGAPTKGAKESSKGAKEPTAGPDAADSPATALANGHASAPEQPETPDFSEPRKTLGAEQMDQLAEGSGAPAKAKAPRRSKAEKKPVIEIPAIIDDKTPFVPPAAILKRDVAEVDEEEERERARLRNAEAAREAEARKERKRRKAEAAKARTAKAKDASKAAAAATADDDKAAKDPAGPEVEEPLAAVTAVEVAPVSVTAPSAAVAATKSSGGGGGKPAGRVGKHIGAPVAKSRLLVNRKKGALQRAWAFINQHLPKSLVYKLLLAGLVGLLAIWLLVEVLPRGLRA